MEKGGNGGGDDQIDNQDDDVVDGPPKSPWKTPAAVSPVVAADSESWPALSDAQQRVKNNGAQASVCLLLRPILMVVVVLCRQHNRDENLKKDPYLISVMDKHGWVPISIIADFKRVKRMNAEIPFILDALQASETIEGEKVRRRSGWSEWISASAISKPSSMISNAVKMDGFNENKEESPE
ncbi:hypothetical protein OROMI_016356 [Orobanche minor]